MATSVFRHVRGRSLWKPRHYLLKSYSQTIDHEQEVKKLLDNANQNRDITDPDVPIEFPSDLEQWDKYNKWYRQQNRHAKRPKISPEETSIVLFPGQGSQFVGMGAKLLKYPNVETMYELANSVLGYDLLHLCMYGPKEVLDKTEHCQPAVFVASLAAVEKLKEDNPRAIENCIATAGFSVGEYAALVFSGAITFEDALEVVKVRAESMQKASEAVPSGMMTVFLRPEARVKLACSIARRFCEEKIGIEKPVCKIANYLYPDCKVIAGHREALEFIEKASKDFGIRRCQWLPVSGAFHTELMAPAATPLSKILKQTTVKQPLISVHSNVNSHRYNKPNSIRQLLVKQITEPVQWEQTLHVLYSRPEGNLFPDTFEMGPGKQLGAMLKMVNSKAHQCARNIPV